MYINTSIQAARAVPRTARVHRQEDQRNRHTMALQQRSPPRPRDSTADTNQLAPKVFAALSRGEHVQSVPKK